MQLPDVISIILSGFAFCVAIVAVWISWRGYKLSEMRNLPNFAIRQSWHTEVRGVSFELEVPPDRPDWGVEMVKVRRDWRRLWRKGSKLTLGEITGMLAEAVEFPIYEPVGEWKDAIFYRRPIREGCVFLDRHAPDCEVTLVIALNTSPKHRTERHFRSRKEPREEPRA